MTSIDQILFEPNSFPPQLCTAPNVTCLNEPEKHRSVKCPRFYLLLTSVSIDARYIAEISHILHANMTQYP